jgi:hypothetical protein
MGYRMPTGGYIGDTYTGGGSPGGGTPYNYSSTSSTSSGIPELRPKVVSNLNTALSGELPEDVVTQIRNRAAEFGVASGMPGSEFAGYQGLRNLGLTSLDRMQHAEDLLTPGYQQHNQTTYSPGSPADAMAWTNHSNEVNGFNRRGSNGEVPAYVNPGHAGGFNQVPGMPKAPDSHALIGDFLAKYLPGGGGGGSSFSSPMGSNFNSGGGAGVPGSDNWGDVPGFYAGSANGFKGGSGFNQGTNPNNSNNMSNSDMVNAGLIDPLFDQPQDYQGDVNNYDWGDEAYA